MQRTLNGSWLVDSGWLPKTASQEVKANYRAILCTAQGGSGDRWYIFGHTQAASSIKQHRSMIRFHNFHHGMSTLHYTFKMTSLCLGWSPNIESRDKFQRILRWRPSVTTLIIVGAPKFGCSAQEKLIMLWRYALCFLVAGITDWLLARDSYMMIFVSCIITVALKVV